MMEQQPINQPTVNSPLEAVQKIILKPNQVFARLKDVSNWSWIPFILVMFFAILPSYYYFQMIDFDWYVNMLLGTQGDMSPAEEDFFRNSMNPDAMLPATIATIIIGFVVITAVMAFYLSKITQIDEENTMTFGDWYGFMWWASLPLVVTSIASLLIMLIAGHPEMEPTALNPFNLTFLLGMDMNSDWFTLTQNISIDNFWCMYLIAVGVSQWTNLTSKQCYMIACAPYAIIWGVWALFILL